jgi:hypothetical protein
MRGFTAADLHAARVALRFVDLEADDRRALPRDRHARDDRRERRVARHQQHPPVASRAFDLTSNAR